MGGSKKYADATLSFTRKARSTNILKSLSFEVLHEGF